MLPQVHVTNYQQYINADYLSDAIAGRLPGADMPENVYASIAYMQVGQKSGGWYTVLVLSIMGKSYRYELLHDHNSYYTAQVNFDLNNFNNLHKDTCILLFNTAFEEVVLARINKIVKDILKAYKK